jgi:Vitamin B12 dependent methionine synthase, activation domain
MHQLRLFEMLVGPPRLTTRPAPTSPTSSSSWRCCGITLSEEDQLDPEQSTSAIVVHHPQAKYFSV